MFRLLFLCLILGTKSGVAVDIFFEEEPDPKSFTDDQDASGEEQCENLYSPDQARDLREAIMNFRELTSGRESERLRREGHRLRICNFRDTECRSCSSAMVEFFARKGLLSSKAAEQRLRAALNIRPDDHLRYHCARFPEIFRWILGPKVGKSGKTRRRRETGALSTSSRPRNGIPLPLAHRYLVRLAFLSKRMSFIGNKLQPVQNISVYERDLSELRRKRDEEELKATLGKRYEISCVRRRAEPRSGWFQLCDSCWSWRQLPRKFSPRIVNELLCSPSSSRCLSGLGTCKQEFSTLSVSEKLPGGKYREHQIQVAAGCTCSLYRESPLQSLIEQ